MKEKVFKKFKELQKIATENFIYVNPTIIFDLDSISMVGYYDTNDNTIHLNEKLLEEFKEDYINEVLVHEFAHAVTWAKFGPTVRTHGKEWKAIARKLGLKNPKSTTDLPIVNSKYYKSKNKYVYKCNCSEYHLSTRMHNNIQKKRKKYQCKYCKAELKFDKIA